MTDVPKGNNMISLKVDIDDPDLTKAPDRVPREVQQPADDCLFYGSLETLSRTVFDHDIGKLANHSSYFF